MTTPSSAASACIARDGGMVGERLCPREMNRQFFLAEIMALEQFLHEDDVGALPRRLAHQAGRRGEVFAASSLQANWTTPR